MTHPIIQDDLPLIKEIAIIWHIEDVQNVRPDLSDAEASIVLQRLKKNHDADEGINWLTIEVLAGIIFPEPDTTLTDEV